MGRLRKNIFLSINFFTLFQEYITEKLVSPRNYALPIFVAHNAFKYLLVNSHKKLLVQLFRNQLVFLATLVHYLILQVLNLLKKLVRALRNKLLDLVPIKELK